jgi:hypothetical protein
MRIFCFYRTELRIKALHEETVWLSSSSCKGEPSHPAILFYEPDTVFTNGVIHGIRCKIGTIWPLNRSHYNLRFGKHCRITQGLKDGAIDARIAQKRAHVNLTCRSIAKSHLQPGLRQDGHRCQSPRVVMSYARIYFWGSIVFGVCIRLHRFQFSINSSRCSVAHSSTSASARCGKEPRMTRKSRRSNSASCSAYRA